LILTFTVNNWKDYYNWRVAKQSRESDQNWSRRNLPSRQHQTLYIFGDPSKIERAWLKSFDAFLIVMILHHQNQLFQSLQNSLNGVKLTSTEACENHLS